jgi:hypothetical protein
VDYAIDRCAGTSLARVSVWFPRKTPLLALLSSLFERVKGLWGERFERSYGFWRGLVDDAVARYLDCGVSGKRLRQGSLPDLPRSYLALPLPG